MPAGLIIPSLISAGATAYAAKKQSDAAKDAAKTQAAGAKDAQGYIDKSYEEGKAALAPWTNAGQVALGSLMSTGGYGPAMAAATAPAPAPTYPLADLWYARDRGDRPATGRAVPRDPSATPESIIAGARDPRRANPRTTPGDVQTDAQAQTQSSYVQMRAPDGSVQPVESQYVKHYTDLGATVVG